MAVSERVKEKLSAASSGASIEPHIKKLDKLNLIHGLNYYASNCELKDSKAWALKWVSKRDKALAQKLHGVREYKFSNRGFICRLIDRADAPGDMESVLLEFFAGIATNEPLSSTQETPVAPKPAPKRHHINTSMQSLNDEIETALAGGKQGKFTFSHTSRRDLDEVVAYCKRTLKEMTDHRDCYHLETIVNLRPVLKSAIEQAESLILHLEKNKAATTAPKNINPIQMTKAVKFLKEIPELRLKSLQPSAVVGAKKLYVYDSSKRKLIVLLALDSKGIMFSGTTLKNYDAVKSQCKTIRNPEKFFGHFKDGITISQLNKYFSEINSKPTPVPTGRTNEGVIFLKVSENV